MRAEPERADERNRVVRLLDASVLPAIAPWLEETWLGQENVPAHGGVVVAGNHLSYADPFVLARFLLRGARRAPHFLGKAEVFALPLVGRLLREAGQIPVHRGTSRAADSFAEAVSAVEAGRLVCLLPEGTLTKDPNLWPMAGKSGAARIALTTGCPLVPVAMWGPERLIPPGSRVVTALPRALLRRHPVEVTAGPAVNLDDLRGRPIDTDVLTEATRRLMRDITHLLAGLRGEQPPQEIMANPRVVSRHVRSTKPRYRGEGR